MKYEYDIVLIGGGSAGLTGARFAARAGAKVALVEGGRIGGDCTWTGCVPSKALIHAAGLSRSVRAAHELGLGSGDFTLDASAAHRHVRDAIQTVYEEESPDVLRQEGIDVLLERGRFTDPHTLQVGEGSVTARRFVVCTGAVPSLPPIPGLDGVGYLTHESIFDEPRTFEHLLVIGAGPIGLELAQAFHDLGSRVTVLATELLPEADSDVRAFVERDVFGDGMELVLGTIDAVRADGDRTVVEAGGAAYEGDGLLVAAGRRPRVDGLGLDAARVAYDRAGIQVDGSLRTSQRHIFAAGDVTGGPQFTHLAGWQAFQAVRNALFPGSAAGMPKVLPRVTFLAPEIAEAGLGEDEAREKLREDLRVHRLEMSASDRAVTEGRTDGFLKLIADRKGRIHGAVIVADRAGEMIGELVLAIEHGLDIGALASAVHPYPTWSSAIQQLASDVAISRAVDGRLGRFGRWLGGLGR